MQKNKNVQTVACASRSRHGGFVGAVLALAGLLAFMALMQSAAWPQDVARISAEGWGQYASVIVGNKTAALWHAALMTLLAGVFFWLLGRWPAHRFARGLAWGFVLLVALDALWLSRHYIKTMSLEAVRENEVIRILKSDPERRVALLSQDGVYNFWLTYLFPYHHIRVMNVTQMPRMPVEYKLFQERVGRNILRYWQLSSVGYVLAPAQFWTQIHNDPASREDFELVFAYNMAPNGMYFDVVPATREEPGQHVIMRLKRAAPRCALLAGWRLAADAEALDLLGSPDFPLFETLLIAPEFGADLPTPETSGMTGSARVVEYRPGYMKLKVSNDRPACLRISEKYDPDWRAWINGAPAPVMRVDYLFQGVMIGNVGLHDVVLRYAPSRRLMILQWIGLAVCLGAVLCLLRRRQVAVRAMEAHGE